MRYRQVAGFVLAVRKGDPDYLGFPGIEAGRFQVDGKSRCRGEVRKQGFEILLGKDGAVARCRKTGLAGQLLHKRGEAVFPEQLGQLAVVGRGKRKVSVAILDGSAAVDGGKPAREPGLVGVLPDALAGFPLDFRGSLHQGIQGAIFQDKLDGGFFANARHTRDVVRTVARKPQDIHHPLRSHAEAFNHLGNAGCFVLHGVQQSDRLSDDLHEVLVTRYHHHLHALCLALPGHGADDVVCFVVLEFQDRYVERAHHLLDGSDLGDQVLGHCGPGGLVLGEELGAKGAAAGVEHHCYVIRVPVFQHLEQHLGKSVERIGGEAFGRRKVPYGVIGAVDIGGTVDQVEYRSAAHLCNPLVFRFPGKEHKCHARPPAGFTHGELHAVVTPALGRPFVQDSFQDIL